MQPNGMVSSRHSPLAHTMYTSGPTQAVGKLLVSSVPSASALSAAEDDPFRLFEEERQGTNQSTYEGVLQAPLALQPGATGACCLLWREWMLLGHCPTQPDAESHHNTLHRQNDDPAPSEEQCIRSDCPGWYIPPRRILG